MKTTVITAWATLALILAACSTDPEIALDAPTDPNTVPELSESWGGQASRIDEQGAVTVEITPLNLDNPGNSIDFQVSLNTHSVDLSMDLAALATLTTDAGVTVQALLWDAPLGGHHVSGTLTFPAETGDAEILNGAVTITLKLIDVDAPERVFTWEK